MDGNTDSERKQHILGDNFLVRGTLVLQLWPCSIVKKICCYFNGNISLIHFNSKYYIQQASILTFMEMLLSKQGLKSAAETMWFMKILLLGTCTVTHSNSFWASWHWSALQKAWWQNADESRCTFARLRRGFVQYQRGKMYTRLVNHSQLTDWMQM